MSRCICRATGLSLCLALAFSAAAWDADEGPREQAARHWANRDNQADCQQAIAFLKQTLEADPAWIDGWAWLAQAYYWEGNNQPEQATEERKNSYRNGMDAGQKATALDENNIAGWFWYIVNKSSYGRERGIVASATYLPEIQEVTARVQQADHTYFYGGVHRLNARIIMKTPGWLRKAKGYDLKDAQKELEASLAVEDRFTLTHLYMADLYFLMEKPDLAREQLEIVLATPEDAIPGQEAAVRRDKRAARERMDGQQADR